METRSYCPYGCSFSGKEALMPGMWIFYLPCFNIQVSPKKSQWPADEMRGRVGLQVSNHTKIQPIAASAHAFKRQATPMRSLRPIFFSCEKYEKAC